MRINFSYKLGSEFLFKLRHFEPVYALYFPQMFCKAGFFLNFSLFLVTLRVNHFLISQTIMKKVFTLLAFVALCFYGNNAFGQARIVSTGGPFLVMDEGTSGTGVYLVVENPNNNAVAPSSGVPNLNIVSEHENNVVKWFLNSASGNFILPFSSPTGTSVRTIYNVPTGNAGIASANSFIEFSTYNTGTDNLPLPTGINHLTNFNIATGTGSTSFDENAPNTFDRFWLIDINGYSTNPSPRLFFGYDPQDIITPGNNVMNTSNLMVQRFNPGAGSMGQWADFFFPSVGVLPGNVIGPTDVPSAEMYRSWTISNFDEPLSVELLDFTAQCEDNRAIVKWSTATEQNSDYFTIERSSDGEFWETVEEVDAAGNSSFIMNYSVYDENAKSGINYYRVTETDINGTESVFGPVSTSCGTNAFEIVNVLNDYSSNGELDIIVNTSEDKLTDIRIIDMAGKLVYERPNEMIQEGVSTITLNKGDLAMGVYFIAIQSSDEILTRKVVLN